MARGINGLFIPLKSCSNSVVEEIIPQLEKWGFNFGKTTEKITNQIKDWTQNPSNFDGIMLQQKGHEKIWPKCQKVTLKSLLRDGSYKKIHQVDITLISEDDILWLQM